MNTILFQKMVYSFLKVRTSLVLWLHRRVGYDTILRVGEIEINDLHGDGHREEFVYFHVTILRAHYRKIKAFP